MTLAELLETRAWESLSVTINGSSIDFALFPWDEVKEREEDGSSNIWEYFIGWKGPAFDKVDAGDWIPFGAGNMYAGALRDDGGFQETGHTGMLFAEGTDSTPSPNVYYFNLRKGGSPILVAKSLDGLL